MSYLTSAGHGTGSEWRRLVGLPGGGPSTVVTSLGVFGFDEAGEMILVSLHPGIAKEEVQANTGWSLQSAATVGVILAPTIAELTLIRRFDTLAS